MKKQLRVRGGGAESTPQKDSTGSPQSSPPSSERVQSGLGKFFGSGSQKRGAEKPVSESLQPQKRQRLSRFQQDAMRERNELLIENAELKAQKAERDAELIEIAKKTARLVKREPQQSPQAKSSGANRKKPGTASKRAEISAETKVKYCEEMLADKPRFPKLEDFWQVQVKKYGISKKQLSHMLANHESYKEIASQNKLKNMIKQEKSKRKRAEGAGRKPPFPDIISSMKQWLSLERACDNTISKQDLMAEFMARLQLTANELRNKASSQDITALQRAELLRDSTEREERKKKLLEVYGYRKTNAQRLVGWLGAKFMATELVTNISATEAETRTKLTWQEFDHSLWLSACASQQVLAESKRVSSPVQFISARPQLVIGFSDQVPLWAKATGRRAVFAQEEIQKTEDVKDFSSVRQAIKEIMHSAGGPDMVVGQLAQPIKQLSFESSQSSPKDAVVRQLSFASADTSSPDKLSEKHSLVKKDSFESAALSQSPEKQIVPASPEQNAEASTQQGAASSSQPSAPAAKPALPQPGSTTLIGISGEDRYRITYEARQLLHNVYASEDEEVIGSVGKGLLVVPGQWARLSNISDMGTWIQTENFKVGDTVITRTQGTSAGRILLPYRNLRKSHPDLMSKIELMQPMWTLSSSVGALKLKLSSTQHHSGRETASAQCSVTQQLRPWHWQTRSVAWWLRSAPLSFKSQTLIFLSSSKLW